MKTKNSKSGFSLVELSIVLIIIGLLITGISSGGQLIQQARLQSVIRDFNSYDIAFRTFNLTYDALPGDFADATDFWTTTPVQLDGDGDGQLEWDNDGGEAWEHLNQSEVFGNNLVYTALADYVIGTSIPQGAINGSGISALYCDGAVTSPATLITDCDMDLTAAEITGNYFVLGAMQSPTPDPDGYNKVGVLNQADAFSIDDKMDDGSPISGSLRATITGTTTIGLAGCVITTTNVYNRTGTGTPCALYSEIN
jgi:prepilin-type N-terminal cleavage/methylation domain-containing protein